MVYTPPPRLANYRDPVLEMEALMRNFARPLNEDALQLALKDRAKYYRNDGPDLVHTLTGKTLEEQEGNEAWVTENAPHWFLDYTVPDENQRLQDLIDQATGRNGKPPTLKARGELVKEVGQRRFEQILAEYGCDARNLKPAANPTGEAAPAKVDPADRKNNPWHRGAWNITRQGQIVKAMGPEKAAQIAAAVGCKLGDVRPNPRYS
jgi:hypothetical protein